MPQPVYQSSWQGTGTKKEKVEERRLWKEPGSLVWVCKTIVIKTLDIWSHGGYDESEHWRKINTVSYDKYLTLTGRQGGGGMIMRGWSELCCEPEVSGLTAFISAEIGICSWSKSPFWISRLPVMLPFHRWQSNHHKFWRHYLVSSRVPNTSST